MQDIFVITFDPQLADIVRGGVVSQLSLFIQAIDVFIVNFGDVADNVGQSGIIGIVAALIAFDFHAGKTVLVNRETGDLHFTEIDFHRNGGKAVRAGALFFKVRYIVIGEIDNVAQRIQRLLNVVDLLRHHFQLVNRAVERQRRAVAIVDNAAARRNRDQLDAVFV